MLFSPPSLLPPSRIITNSLALVADSFHMLSDVVALWIGYMAINVSVGGIGSWFCLVFCSFPHLPVLLMACVCGVLGDG